MQTADAAWESDHLTFTRWLSGLMSNSRLIVATITASVLVTVAATIIVPPVYRAHASFVANASSASKLPAGIGGASGFGGLISELGGSLGGDPSESPQFYLSLLGSRELQTRLLLSRFPNPRTDAPNDSATLLSILKLKGTPAQQLEAGVKLVNKAVSAGMDPHTNFVWFSVDAQWAPLSADVANRLIGLVSNFNRETRVSRAKSKRLFLQMRYDSAQAALRFAEDRERSFYEQNRGLLTAPALKFEEQRIKRDAELAGQLYMSLAAQLETARIDEVNDAALITVIDSAVVPRKAQWPRYGSALLASVLIGFVFGVLLAGSAAILQDWARRNPEDWDVLASRFRRGSRRKVAASDGVVTASVSDALRLEDTSKTTRRTGR
jgi:uncharacterized protein involved in exopolysaccharide biosynthesis